MFLNEAVKYLLSGLFAHLVPPVCYSSSRHFNLSKQIASINNGDP